LLGDVSTLAGKNPKKIFSVYSLQSGGTVYINFVKDYAKKHNLPFKQAMTKASKAYQKNEINTIHHEQIYCLSIPYPCF